MTLLWIIILIGKYRTCSIEEQQLIYINECAIINVICFDRNI